MQVGAGTFLDGAGASVQGAFTAPPGGRTGAARTPAAGTVAAAIATARGTRAAAAGEILRDFGRVAAERNAELLGDLLSKLVRGVLTGEAGPASAGSSARAASSARTTAKAKATGALAFLQDPRLSVEEKLARLMVYLSDKYEKQLEKKLRQYADLEQGKGTPKSASSASSGAAGGSGGGFLDGILGLAGKVFPVLAGIAGGPLASIATGLATQVAGPVLGAAASALGMPAIAPLLMGAAPAVASMAGGALSGLVSGASGSSGAAPSASAGSGSTSGAGTTGELPSEKQLMTEIQILQEKQKEMFTLVSNILRAMHDTKMGVIGNIR
jgi:hypothetical protein